MTRHEYWPSYYKYYPHASNPEDYSLAWVDQVWGTPFRPTSRTRAKQAPIDPRYLERIAALAANPPVRRQAPPVVPLDLDSLFGAMTDTDDDWNN